MINPATVWLEIRELTNKEANTIANMAEQTWLIMNTKFEANWAFVKQIKQQIFVMNNHDNILSKITCEIVFCIITQITSEVLSSYVYPTWRLVCIICCM
jgi:hypothetical protein